MASEKIGLDSFGRDLARLFYAIGVATYPERGILMHYGDYTKDHSQLNDLFEFLGEPVDREAIEKTFSKRLDHAR
jgi:hypothetical protein